MIKRICILLGLGLLLCMPANALPDPTDFPIRTVQVEAKAYEGRIVNFLPYLVKYAIDDRATGEQLYNGQLIPNEVHTLHLPEGEFDIYLTAFSENGEQIAGDHFLFIIQEESVPVPYRPFEIWIGRP